MDAPDAAREPPARASRLDALATLAIVGGLIGILAVRSVARRLSPHPSREQCAAMLDRYAEHTARAADLGPASPRPGQTLGTPDVDRCARELTQEEVDCAMRSNSADQLEQCLP